MTTLAQPRLLTIAETAERLGVSETTVRRKIRSGEIPAVRLGGRGSHIRVDERELDLWVYGWRQP